MEQYKNTYKPIPRMGLCGYITSEVSESRSSHEWEEEEVVSG